MATPIGRPSFVTEGHLEFLDRLRASNVTNMIVGVGPYIEAEYPELSAQEVVDLLAYWIKIHKSRHP